MKFLPPITANPCILCRKRRSLMLLDTPSIAAATSLTRYCCSMSRAQGKPLWRTGFSQGRPSSVATHCYAKYSTIPGPFPHLRPSSRAFATGMISQIYTIAFLVAKTGAFMPIFYLSGRTAAILFLMAMRRQLIATNSRTTLRAKVGEPHGWIRSQQVCSLPMPIAGIWLMCTNSEPIQRSTDNGMKKCGRMGDCPQAFPPLSVRTGITLQYDGCGSDLSIPSFVS